MTDYQIDQLKEMLDCIYSGKSDVAAIDELIAWLQHRREAIDSKSSGCTCNTYQLENYGCKCKTGNCQPPTQKKRHEL